MGGGDSLLMYALVIRYISVIYVNLFPTYKADIEIILTPVFAACRLTAVSPLHLSIINQGAVTMHLSPFRVALLVVFFVVSHLVLADQKIKTKSNIKNDRLAESSSTAACADQKEGSADGKTACKTEASQSAVSSAPAKAAETTKP